MDLGRTEKGSLRGTLPTGLAELRTQKGLLPLASSGIKSCFLGPGSASHSRPGRTGSDLFSFPAPSAGGLPLFPAGGSAGHQLNLLDHNGRRQGAPGPHPG